MQHRLKSASGAAGAEVFAAEFLDGFDMAVDDAIATFNVGLGAMEPATFAHDLKRRPCRRWSAMPKQDDGSIRYSDRGS
ncbi:hypothetical protein CHELA20_52882 [Hyphomicrobiales bacterium]|jgi:hypothetical protein|nr:hypothetical protein CHELA41_22044 [Hyphomicrobiales bacterium]CAH1683138.1 hypothetical protein CHELA20_52882 [Hyphomicrobiales bacterium]